MKVLGGICLILCNAVVSSDFDHYDQRDTKRLGQESVIKITVPEEQALTELFNKNGLKDFDQQANVSSNLGGLTLSASDYVERVSDLCKSFKGVNTPTLEKVIGVISGDNSGEWLQSIGELPDSSKWLSMKKS